jgi:small subunit ribosomal protein SAe
MSSNLTHKEDCIQKLLISNAHLGGRNVTKPMKNYVYGKNKAGVCMFDVNKQYEKICVAARIIASIPDTKNIISVSGRIAGQRSVYKFGKFTESTAISGRWSPGTLTNQITDKFCEPRLLVLTDPRIDYNALKESSYMNIPIIALCNTDNNLDYVDCAIPCNNRSKKSLAMVYWLLTREVLMLRGKLENNQFTELVDLFMYRDLEKEDKERKEAERAERENQNDDQGNVEEDDGEDNFVEN